jgi:hypothetical protein
MERCCYYGTRCGNEICGKWIPLKAVKFDESGQGETLVMTFEPFEAVCRHCSRPQMCSPENVELFFGPEPEPTFQNHPALR